MGRLREFNNVDMAYVIRHAHKVRTERNPKTLGDDVAWLTTHFNVRIDDVTNVIKQVDTWHDARATEPRTPLNGNEKTLIHTYIKLAGDPEEEQVLLTEIAAILHIEREAVVQVLQGYLTLTNGKKRRKQAVIGSGEHINYDTPTKRAWRRTCSEFIGTHLAPGMNTSRHGLTIPGKHMLEVKPMFDRHQFAHKNITAVEGGDVYAQADIIDTNNQLPEPLHIVQGRLEDHVRESKQRYRLVVVDAIGQLCKTFLNDICKQILLDEEAVVILNTAGKRERQEVQDILQAMHDQLLLERLTTQQMDAFIHQFLGKQHPQAELQTNHANETPLEELREHLNPGITVLGEDRTENYGLGGRVKRLPLLSKYTHMQHSDARATMQANTQQILNTISILLFEKLQATPHFPVNNRQEILAMFNMITMVQDVAFGNKYVIALQKWKYTSKTATGKYKSTFNTNMAHIRTPRGVYQQRDVRAATAFWLDAAEQWIHALNESATEAYNMLHFEIIRGVGITVEPSNAKKSDKLALIRNGELCEEVAPIQLATLLRANANHLEFMNECSYASLDAQARVQRQRIAVRAQDELSDQV